MNTFWQSFMLCYFIKTPSSRKPRPVLPTILSKLYCAPTLYCAFLLYFKLPPHQPKVYSTLAGHAQFLHKCSLSNFLCILCSQCTASFGILALVWDGGFLNKCFSRTKTFFFFARNLSPYLNIFNGVLYAIWILHNTSLKIFQTLKHRQL